MGAGGPFESHSYLLLHFDIFFGPSYGTHLENAEVKTIWLANAFSCYDAICLLCFQFYNQINSTSGNYKCLRNFRTYHSV